MANTARDRRSLLDIGRGKLPWMRRSTVPAGDGKITLGDKLQLLAEYQGFAYYGRVKLLRVGGRLVRFGSSGKLVGVRQDGVGQE